MREEADLKSRRISKESIRAGACFLQFLIDFILLPFSLVNLVEAAQEVKPFMPPFGALGRDEMADEQFLESYLEDWEGATRGDAASDE